ncbi:hypothetical protein N7478_001148 [Penicillium angulare]|uniref:uncharacterized protein n=1 Tax=Penicillium angulare TaxID=116970 RepID=UPI0025418033|nr:uncharacterized protein N7478_001148 [Penicillium angulare]KAJ5291897.1 hypothetical protein N7478_001148 [Penicillium angulare]
MTLPFQIVEHTLPGQHIRDYPNSTKESQETVLQIAIKQYIPLDLPMPIPDNAVTIIGAPGNGTPKELYEPLWEDLYAELKQKQIPVRGIWVADISNQGASGVLNEYTQGDQTGWWDHSRDLLHMVNHFRDQFTRPIIGVAHSMGGAQLVNLSIIHPRLFSTLVLFDPVIMAEGFGGSSSKPTPNPAIFSSRRRDLWPSAEKAKEALSKGLKRWDPRARERYFTYCLRNVPTAIYDPADPKVGSKAVTLTTTKHQESWTYTTPNLEPESLDRLLLADWSPKRERPFLFSRPECWSSFRHLPHLRPSVQFVFAGKSYLSPPGAQDAKMQVTGTLAGGNGGVDAGAVEKAVLEDGEHTFVFDRVGWCAGVSSQWIQKWYNGWLADEKFWKEYRSRHSDENMLRLSEEALLVAKINAGTKREDFPKSKL